MFSLNISQIFGNILLIILPDILVPVLSTGTSDTPLKVFRRSLNTIININSWYNGNPFDKNSAVHLALQRLRQVGHLQTIKLLNQNYPDKKLTHPLLDQKSVWMSQYDMVITQWSWIGFISALPDQCGFYLKECLDNCCREVLSFKEIDQKSGQKTILVAKKSSDGYQV